MNWVLSQVWTVIRSAWRRLRRSDSRPGTAGEQNGEGDRFDSGDLKAGYRDKAESDVCGRAGTKPVDDENEASAPSTLY